MCIVHVDSSRKDAKMGEIKLSRGFPVLNYRYKTAQLFQLPDCGWRQKPDYTNRKPGSRRWMKAVKRAAKNKRKAANIRKTISHKISRVISDSATHTAMENLPIQNMAKSAKSTEEKPGKNVAQKSGLNKAILQQCWGLLALLLAYKLAGEIVWVAAAYTSQRCCSCGYTHKDNRDGRKFLCKRCGFTYHADCNAGMNIEDMGLEKLGPNAIHGQLKLRESGYADRTQVMGCLDVEGSYVRSPMKRQARTGGRTVVLWRDV